MKPFIAVSMCLLPEIVEDEKYDRGKYNGRVANKEVGNSKTLGDPESDCMAAPPTDAQRNFFLHEKLQVETNCKGKNRATTGN